MAIHTTQFYNIKYPDTNEPPTIAKHLEDVAKGIDSAMKVYQDKIDNDLKEWKRLQELAYTDFNTKWTGEFNKWTAAYDVKLNNINAQLAAEGWGVPTTITGTIATAGTGYTADAGSRAVKVGNMVAWTYKFRKTAAPAIAAGASGNLSGSLLVGTFTAAMPTPTTFTPFSTMEDGFQLMGVVNTTKQLLVTALPPNTNLPNAVAFTIGGIYMFNPLVP